MITTTDYAAPRCIAPSAGRYSPDIDAMMRLALYMMLMAMPTHIFLPFSAMLMLMRDICCYAYYYA